MSDESLRSSKDTLHIDGSGYSQLQNLPQLAVAIRSPDKNVHIPALKSILDIVINEPQSIDALYENDIVNVLNKYIGSEEVEDAYVLSSTILHVIGVRSKVIDSNIRAGTATESFVQIIHSSNEKQSKAGSKALCDLIEENETIRNSLLTTGFIQVVIHTLTSGSQVPSQSSSSSSSQIISDSPTFVKVGLLDVILRLVTVAEGLQPLSILIPLLEEQKKNGETELKVKARKILGQLSSEGINDSSGNEKENEKDQKIKELKDTNKKQDEQLKQKDEELMRKDEEIKRDKEELKQKDKILEKEKLEKEKLAIQIQKEREEKEKEKKKANELQLENARLKAELTKAKQLVSTVPQEQITSQPKPQQTLQPSQSDFPIAIINKDPDCYEFIYIDGYQKKINKKKNERNTISLVQVLDNGIWTLEALFQNTGGYATIGIVRDSYDIPAKADYSVRPHTNHIAAFCGGNSVLPVYYNGKGTGGNAYFQDNQILRLEFDSFKGILILFIDNVQQPVYFSGIKEKVQFVICLNDKGASCTIRSLKKLNTSTSKHLDNEKIIQW
ncbi:MAG: hypothetical protein EZS28_019835 [Streblomastix strix]|uniref:Uncharacterized protein n=1 Tax=Streblomastix strix TaxID=222440 RepID=A0A5J4VPQ5_9EUKA|nr:MAG: hypothetical protein EZS28_019835 [Streblomastix strix]